MVISRHAETPEFSSFLIHRRNEAKRFVQRFNPRPRDEFLRAGGIIGIDYRNQVGAVGNVVREPDGLFFELYLSGSQSCFNGTIHPGGRNLSESKLERRLGNLVRSQLIMENIINHDILNHQNARRPGTDPGTRA
jgi:hypothetical protein